MAFKALKEPQNYSIPIDRNLLSTKTATRYIKVALAIILVADAINFYNSAS
jgi:hypothetical protein